MASDHVPYEMRRVYEWLDKSCTGSIRNPLRVVENGQFQRMPKKRKRTPELPSKMDKTPSPQTRTLAVGSGEFSSAQNE